MKNVHILPTDKPSRLFISDTDKVLELDTECIISEDYWIKNQNIYITSDEEIKEGDWFAVELFKITGESDGLHIEKCTKLYDVWFNNFDVSSARHKGNCKKIILTTDQDLIGVQAIDDEFLEWFVNKASDSGKAIDIVEVEKEQYHTFVGMKKYPMIPNYKIIIPKEEPKQETLEEVAEIWVNNRFTKQIKDEDIYASKSSIIESHILFAKWQQERSYSEEEALNLLTHFAVEIQRQNKKGQYPIEIKGWFERNKETFKKK